MKRKNFRQRIVFLLLCLPLLAAAQGRMGAPVVANGSGEIFLRHTAFIASYDAAKRCPTWVAWTLMKFRTEGSEERSSRFTPDPQLAGRGATHADYTKSGYDRGHMCPAADNRWSEAAMKESFYTSNICPQTPALNRGSWKNFEERLRDMVATGDTIYIVCGPIFSSRGKQRTIAKGRVSVPTGFFKVCLLCNGGPKRAAGFIFSNVRGKEKQYSIVTVDEVERLTGINFFPNLTAAQEAIEATVSKKRWK